MNPIANLARQPFVENSNSIKLPQFSNNDPEMWFAQVESIFERNRIETECSKAQIIMAQVDADTLACVRHVVMSNPKPVDAYTQIKNGIIFHFALSQETRMFQLIRGDVISSGKPSHVLSRIRSLNAGNCSEEVLKTIFLAKLPHQHQLVLSSSSEMTLNQMADRADKMAEVDRIANATNAAVSGESSVAKVDEIKSLTDEVAALKTKLEEIQGRKSRNPERRGRGNNNNNNNNNNRGRNRGRPFYRQNYYRGRGRGGSFYQGNNNYGRNFNPRYNDFYRSPSRNRFRSSSPYERSTHSACHHRSMNEQCCSRQQNANNDCASPGN